jgi:hypothetical protein
MSTGEGGICSGGPPCLTQRLPTNQRTAEREERFVDVGAFFIPHAQTAKLVEPGKRPLHDAPPPAQGTPARGATPGEPRHPSSCGSICQGMPLRRTKRIPVRHARSETRGRPPFGRRGGVGKNGSTRSHNGSGSSAAAIPVDATSPTRITCWEPGGLFATSRHATFRVLAGSRGR